MNPLAGLTEYLGRVEHRLRALAFTRGAAVIAIAALLFTVLGVLFANHFAFSGPSVLGARITLFLALALAVAAGLVFPMVTLNRRQAARRAEQAFPQFEERLLTLTERSGSDDPFLNLLAADTLEVARDTEPEQVAAGKWIAGLASCAAGAFIVLVWLAVSGPGFLGYGTSLLWGALPKSGIAPFYDIAVQPGDHLVRRRSDQLVTARLIGFEAPHVTVFARFAGSSKWEQAAMHPQSSGSGHEFLFAGIPESFEYYVEAGGVRSKHYKLGVIDLPNIRRLRVTYHYPSWTGMKDATEDPGGDLRAVEGTVAEVNVETDRPLSNGVLLIDSGRSIDIKDGRASVPIEKDGLYHIAVNSHGESVRLSEDYFIEAQKDSPPVVRVVRPGRDTKVNPVEEVPVAIEASDDFGVRGLDLHYSVNGGPEKTVAMLNGGERKEAHGAATLYLEEYKLVPGDVVSLYATARGARTASRSDMYFIEAQPFELEYSQSQQSGGGGAGEQNNISQRQKEIIAATWNQIRDGSRTDAAAAGKAKFLAGMQGKLRDQAQSLANRMRSRELSGQNRLMESFSGDMQKAAEAMGPAAEKLRVSQWQPALPSEQKALQYLLRAEATFRQIQVAFGNGSGQGMGGGRDLQSLFDLELDTEKNQYESGQQPASGGQKQRQIDEALQKLEELARRQQELAEQKKNQQAFQQRWQQEMLRREAEELRRKMEQLSRGEQSSQQQSQSQSQQGQQGSQGRDGQGTGSEQLERALERLNEAVRDMRAAASSQNAGTPQAEAQSRRAAERLNEARRTLEQLRAQQAGNQVDDLARRAQQLAEEQRNVESRMRQTFGLPGQGGGQSPEQARSAAEQIANQKQRMARELKALEQDMQRGVRDMAGAQPAASGKLREALGNMQQREIQGRIQKGEEFLRRGLGSYQVMRESPVTQGLNGLRDDLRQAQNAVSQQKPGSEKGLEQALAQAEQLRRQMEGQAARGARNGARAEMPGSSGAPYSPLGGGGAHIESGSPERSWREQLRDLQALQRSVESYPELAREVQGMIRHMQSADPRLSIENPLLAQRIQAQVLAGVEEIELRLRRMSDEQSGGSVRTGAGQTAPPGYSDAVAEYFRKLSREK